MKYLKIFMIIFLGIFLFSNVGSQDVPGIEEVPFVKEIQNAHEGIQDQNSSEYLKQEWRKVLEGNGFGRFVLGVSDFFKNFNPLFKAILGVEYSLSWAFVFAVLVWFVLFFFLYQPSSVIFGKKVYGLIGAFAITSLIGLSGTIRLFVNLLTSIIENPWIAWLALGITLIVGLVIIKLGGGLKQMLRKGKEQEEKDQESRDRKILHVDAKATKGKYGKK